MKDITIIRRWLAIFMAALALSGLTAIPLKEELDLLCRLFPLGTTLGDWLDTVYMALVNQQERYPFLAYGYDWLAFAHFVLALLFWGPYRDPVRNRWVIEFGLWCCLLLIPFALVAGAARGIPLWWRGIDCLFGLAGAVPLWIVLRRIARMEPALTLANHPDILPE